MKAHFFDIDTILVIDGKVWIVDKNKPNIPIMKISKADFNLIKSGIYKSQGNYLDFGGHTYWLPTELMEKVKIKSKTYKANITDLAFSLQEFMNKDLIENIDYDINVDSLLHLKNTTDDIYVICSKNNKKNYELMISKIEDKLIHNGLKVKKYYFISETFYNRDSDEVSHKKVRLLLQHLIGFKTEGDKFIDEKLEQYDEVHFYDDEFESIKLSKDCNKLLMFLISNTETNLKSTIKDVLKQKQITLFVNLVTGNKVNKLETTKVALEYSNLIKVFESFKWR